MLAVVARHCINTIVPTMPETHALARKLGAHLESLGVKLLVPVETNMLFIDTTMTGLTIADFAEALKTKNIQIFSNPTTTTRFSTNQHTQLTLVRIAIASLTRICQILLSPVGWSMARPS